MEVLWIAAVFGCVLVHELAHSVTARHYGIPVKDILLLPIGGVSEIEDMPRGPGRELTIAAVGPLTSFAIALVGLVGCVLVGGRVAAHTHDGSSTGPTHMVERPAGRIETLPALPLDGGRVLRAGLAMRMGRSRATVVAARLGRYAGVALLMVGFLYNLWLVLIGIFLYVGAGMEERDEQVRQVLSGRSVADSMVPTPWTAEAHMYVSPVTCCSRRAGTRAAFQLPAMVPPWAARPRSGWYDSPRRTRRRGRRPLGSRPASLGSAG